jgi:hypothetical protein
MINCLFFNILARYCLCIYRQSKTKGFPNGGLKMYLMSPIMGSVEQWECRPNGNLVIILR